MSGCDWFSGLSEREDEPPLRGSPDTSGRPDAGPQSAGAGGLGGLGGLGQSGGTRSEPLPDRRDDGSAAPALDAAIDATVIDDAAIDPDASYPPLSADLTWHPALRRMAVTGDTALPKEDFRAWLVVEGGETPERLVAHRLETRRDAWTDTGISGISSPLDAVSFLEGDVHYQRVFFARAGELHMLVVDMTPEGTQSFEDDAGSVSAPETERLLPDEGFAFERGDVAALSLGAGEERRVIVAAIASHHGVPGAGLCVFERSLAQAQWSRWCSALALDPDSDLSGVVVGSNVHFFARSEALGLLRVTRDGEGAYATSAVATPDNRPIAPSIVAMPAEVGDSAAPPDRVELLLITLDGDVWSARVAAAFDVEPSWIELPSLPLGVRASLDRNALGAIVLSSFGPAAEHEPPRAFTVSLVAVIGTDGALYHHATRANDPARSWLTAVVWGRELAPEHGQSALAIGAMTYHSVGSGAGSFQLPAVLALTGAERARSLDEVMSVYGLTVALGHVRLQHDALALEATSAAELAVALGADDALLAASVRGASTPWTLELAASSDGATSWHRLPALTPLPAHDAIDVAASALAPSVAYGARRMHLVDLEWDLPRDCSAPSTRSRRIVYRRAANPQALGALGLGSPDLFVVAASDALAEPALAVTETTAGATAHVLFDDGEGAVRYWRLSPIATSVPPAPRLDASLLPPGRLQLSTGRDQALFAVSAGDDAVRVCRLDAVRFDATQCSTIVVDAPITVPAREIPFGAPHAAPQGACASVAGQHYKCFRDPQPFAFSAGRHEVTTYPIRLFFAYAAPDPESPTGRSSIYLTSAEVAGVIGEWRRPFRVNPRLPGDERDFFDVEISTTSIDHVYLSYAALEPTAPEQPRSIAQSFVTIIESDSITEYPLATFDLERLEHDCVEQRWALGAYRRPHALSTRALHVLRRDQGEAAEHVTRFIAQFAHP